MFLIVKLGDNVIGSNLQQNKKDINLHSNNALLYNMDSNKDMYKQKSNKKIYPASLTKMMTLLVAAEHVRDIKETVTISHEDLEDVFSTDASVAGYYAGDQVTYKDLMFATILPSGKDATNALANNIAGSEQEFTKLMNNKAKELKMNNTNFTNSSGLHNNNHYTTLDDLKKLINAGMKNKRFKKVMTTTKYISRPLNNKKIKLKSTLFDNLKSKKVNNVKIIGGKTGYTEEAEQCLATIATSDGKTYVLITAGAKRPDSNDINHIKDAKKIYSQLDELE